MRSVLAFGPFRFYHPHQDCKFEVQFIKEKQISRSILDNRTRLQILKQTDLLSSMIRQAHINQKSFDQQPRFSRHLGKNIRFVLTVVF